MEIIIQQLVDVFRPGETILHWEKLSGGHINQTLRVDLPSGKFVFQEMNTSIFQNISALMSNFLLIRNELINSNFPYRIPEFQKWKNGKLLFQDNVGKRWRIMPFWEDLVVKEKAACLKDAEDAGTAFGSLTFHLNRINPQKYQEIIPEFFAVSNRLKQFSEAWSKAEKTEKEKASNSYQLLSARTSIYTRKYSIPIRVIHGDGKMPNLMFDLQGHLKGILDWDTAMPGTILDEFGYLARSIISRKAEDDAIAGTPYINLIYLKTLLAAFQETAGNSISTTEKELLLFGVKRTLWVQSIRFLTDYLSGDQYFPINRKNQNLDRANNQLGMLLELEAS